MRKHRKFNTKYLPRSVRIKMFMRVSSVCHDKTKKKIINRSIEPQQEHTKKCHGHCDWLQCKTLSIKNSYYDRKASESLEIDMAAVSYGQDKVLNRDNRNTVTTNTWKQLFKII